jgi:hypothetical protein
MPWVLAISPLGVKLTGADVSLAGKSMGHRQDTNETFIPGDTSIREGLPFPEVPLPPLRPHHGGLVLGLGILGWGIWVGTWKLNLGGWAVIPGIAGLICGILAWIIGGLDLRAMKKGRMNPTGKAMTKLGVALGSVMTILVICILAATLGAMLLIPPAEKK